MSDDILNIKSSFAYNCVNIDKKSCYSHKTWQNKDVLTFKIDAHSDWYFRSYRHLKFDLEKFVFTIVATLLVQIT